MCAAFVNATVTFSQQSDKIARRHFACVCTATTAHAVIAAYEKTHICVTATCDGKVGQVGSGHTRYIFERPESKTLRKTYNHKPLFSIENMGLFLLQDMACK